jgi:hypothetical protein
MDGGILEIQKRMFLALQIQTLNLEFYLIEMNKMLMAILVVLKQKKTVMDLMF